MIEETVWIIIAVWVSGLPLCAYCLGKWNKKQFYSVDKFPYEAAMLWPLLLVAFILNILIFLPLKKIGKLAERRKW